MPATTVGLKKLSQFNLGLEATPGTTVPATHVWNGDAYATIEDAPFITKYPVGIPMDLSVEDIYLAETGTTIVLSDTECSVEQLVYLFCMSIIGTTASAGVTPFLMDSYTIPSSSTINAIKTFTTEFSDGVQGFKAGYTFAEKISIHGDVDSNQGRILMNAQLRAQKSNTATLTPAITTVPLIEPLNINALTIKIDAPGTAAGTAAQTNNLLAAFDLNITTGWQPDRSASGRSARDFQQAIYNGQPQFAGKLVYKTTAAAYTQLANARTPVAAIVQLKVVGTGTRALTMNLPLAYSKISELERNDRKGIVTLEMEYEAGYSRTVTAQNVGFPVNMSASTTIT